jgi:hypothetical protein
VYYFVYIVTCLLKAGVAESEKTCLIGSYSVNTFLPQPNYVMAVTIEELLEALFSAVRQLELSIG